MLSLRIATRFLRRSPVQSVLIVLGIAVGIGVVVFVGSLITSLQAALIDETIGASPQVTVTGQEGFPVDYTAQLEKVLNGTAGVKPVVPVRTFSAIYSKAGDSAPLTFTGGDLAQLDSIYDLSGRAVTGRASVNGNEVIVGSGFARRFGIVPGRSLAIVLPSGHPATLTVSAVVDLGQAAANDRTAFVSGDFAAEALNQNPAQYSAIATQLDDPFTSVAVAERWRSDPALAELTVTEWQAENQDLLDALAAQDSSSYLIQVFVLIAVALGIGSTLAVSAVQKTRQIGILKAMGLRDSRSAAVFLWQALILGTVGAALGIAVGIGLIAVFNLAGADRAGSFPIDPRPSFVALSFGVGVLVALVSAIIPWRKTSRLDPIEVIQSA